MDLLEELEVAASADPLADLKLTPAPGDWADHAACRAVDDDIFTPARKPEPDALSLVVALCGECPVRAECDAYADKWAMYGVWAGRWIDRTRPQRNAV